MEISKTKRVAFACGGTGDDFRRLCAALGKNGFDVSFTYDDEGDAQVLSAEIEASGVRSMRSRLAAYSAEELSTAIVETAEQMGGIDLLVYMGELPEGYETDGKLLLDLDENDWDIAMNRTARGFFLACKYALPYLIGRQGARIVAVDANPEGCEGGPERSLTAFAASRTLKAACEHLETELSHYGIAAAYLPACNNPAIFIENPGT